MPTLRAAFDAGFGPDFENTGGRSSLLLVYRLKSGIKSPAANWRNGDGTVLHHQREHHTNSVFLSTAGIPPIMSHV